MSAFTETLAEHGISTKTYPHGPEWCNVKPWKAASSGHFDAKSTLPSDMGTTRRLQPPAPKPCIEEGSLRYPGTYVPPPSLPDKAKLHFSINFMGQGVDGITVPVVVKSTATVAEVITAAVEKLRATTGSSVSYSKLRVTGLFSESGRPLAPGCRLHSQGQVPQVRDHSTLVLKVLT
ncbi:hypothetical protein V8C86DRAFT_3142135 [Haematococcus lacustris]